ncbi:hypothetical protein M885DRAFT_199570 [Pelagophyceae sp. CCMP2097]|nr:hypothetical protein M885DRAFT_199570 [Pelagophyceae sp. CCMP2097]
MQLKKTTDSDYRSITSSARTIVRCHGARALYTGLSAALLNQGGKTGVQFAAYSWWHATLEKACGGSPLTLAGCAGAMAGVTEAAAWTTPIDRVKTLRQAALVEANAAGTLHVRTHQCLPSFSRRLGAVALELGDERDAVRVMARHSTDRRPAGVGPRCEIPDVRLRDAAAYDLLSRLEETLALYFSRGALRRGVGCCQ